jgi:hypothetical protein
VKTKFVVGSEPAASLWLNVLVTKQDLITAVINEFRLGTSVFSGKREIENRLKEQIITRGMATFRGNIDATTAEIAEASSIIYRFFPEFR